MIQACKQPEVPQGDRDWAADQLALVLGTISSRVFVRAPENRERKLSPAFSSSRKGPLSHWTIGKGEL